MGEGGGWGGFPGWGLSGVGQRRPGWGMMQGGGRTPTPTEVAERRLPWATALALASGPDVAVPGVTEV